MRQPSNLAIAKLAVSIEFTPASLIAQPSYQEREEAGKRPTFTRNSSNRTPESKGENAPEKCLPNSHLEWFFNTLKLSFTGILSVKPSGTDRTTTVIGIHDSLVPQRGP